MATSPVPVYVVIGLLVAALIGLGVWCFSRNCGGGGDQTCAVPVRGAQLYAWGGMVRPSVTSDAACQAMCAGHLAWTRDQRANNCWCVDPPSTGWGSTGTIMIANPTYNSGFLGSCSAAP